MTTKVTIEATEAHAVSVSTLADDWTVLSKRTVDRGETAVFYAHRGHHVLVQELTLEEERAEKRV